ncbi:P-loop containing nucleoside triphosphate hydrolase protein, partial [Pholiota conissans]
SSGLSSLQHENSHITLDTEIAGGGSNLSVGQRQIIALARAIVRESKVLILDEVSSWIARLLDYETDTVIQRTLRTVIGRDVTVITIAHRLQTLLDLDKTMVLDGGKIVGFDKPQDLMSKENGFLRTLVECSKDISALYETTNE